MKSKKATELVRAAKAARLRAYAPYSKFKVGAAVLGKSGKIYSGCNVENASYGLTICAERNAVFQAAAAGERSILAVAIAGSGPGLTAPCGACRQVLNEFGPEAEIVMPASGRLAVFRLSELLPLAFSRKKLR